MFLTAPVSYPIAWVLDRVLGHRHTALFRWVERSGLLGASISAAFVERNQSGLPTHGWVLDSVPGDTGWDTSACSPCRLLDDEPTSAHVASVHAAGGRSSKRLWTFTRRGRSLGASCRQVRSAGWPL